MQEAPPGKINFTFGFDAHDAADLASAVVLLQVAQRCAEPGSRLDARIEAAAAALAVLEAAERALAAKKGRA